MSTTLLLEHLAELADEREASERRFRRVLALGSSMGVPVADLAEKARLSTSRVNGILALEGTSLEPVSEETIEHVLEHANLVVIVPANRVAYLDYGRYCAYICQPNRTFRNDPTRVAFYADQEVKQEVPRIRRTFTDVVFSQDTVAALTASDDVEEAELADIIEHVIANETGGRKARRHYDVMLLTAPGDDDTIKLDYPIRHTRRGRGAAFVRRQRYTSEAALRRMPKTTDELLSFMHG
jgi:hypothetical protein